MTQTTAPASTPLDPANLLMNFIVALLAPMFLGVAAGDIGLARMAAQETVNAYRIRNHADLIAVAQIIAYGLAALGSLSLSMDDTIPLSMVLRLRSNANACTRSAEQNRRTLRQNPAPHDAAPAEDPETWDPVAEAEPEPETFLSAEAAQLLAAEAEARLQDACKPVPPPTARLTSSTTEKRHQDMWAIAMVKRAADLSASLPNLPPAERKGASMRAAILSSTASQLLTGGHSLPPS